MYVEYQKTEADVLVVTIEYFFSFFYFRKSLDLKLISPCKLHKKYYFMKT